MDILSGKTQHIKGTHRNKQCQGGIQTTGYPYNCLGTTCMFITFLQSQGLNGQNFITSFSQKVIIPRNKGFLREHSCKSRFFHKKFTGNNCYQLVISHPEGIHSTSFMNDSPQIQIRKDHFVLESCSLL